MSRYLKPRIEEYLMDRPRGAQLWQIAEHLGSNIDTTVLALRRMSERGEAVMTESAGMHANTTWALPERERTPPVFRAMETLQAMQAAARQT